MVHVYITGDSALNVDMGMGENLLLPLITYFVTIFGGRTILLGNQGILTHIYVYIYI